MPLPLRADGEFFLPRRTAASQHGAAILCGRYMSESRAFWRAFGCSAEKYVSASFNLPRIIIAKDGCLMLDLVGCSQSPVGWFCGLGRLGRRKCWELGLVVGVGRFLASAGSGDNSSLECIERLKWWSRYR